MQWRDGKSFDGDDARRNGLVWALLHIVAPLGRARRHWRWPQGQKNYRQIPCVWNLPVSPCAKLQVRNLWQCLLDKEVARVGFITSITPHCPNSICDEKALCHPEQIQEEFDSIKLAVAKQIHA